MSFLRRMFGGGGAKPDNSGPTPPPPPPAPKQPAANPSQGSAAAVNKVDDTIEAMELREALLLKKIDKEIEMAKQAMAKKNKNQAMLCMKRKKMYEDQLQKMTAQRANMEAMKITIEDSAMTAQVIAAQRAVGHEMQRLNENMGADQVEDDMEKIREEMEKQKEIQELIGQPLGGEFIDEDELMDDLNELIAADKQPAQAQPVQKQPAEKIDLGPAVPKAKLPEPAPVAVEDDEEALRALEAELNA